MKKATKSLSIDDVKHIAKLAKIDLTDDQLKKITPQFSSVLDLVSKVQELDTDGVEETSQVTGLENVFRKDVVDAKRRLSQKDTLSNAKRTYKGYFVVDAIFEEG